MENQRAIEELSEQVKRLETTQRMMLRAIVWLTVGLTVSIGVLCGILAYITEPQVLRSLFFQATGAL